MRVMFVITIMGRGGAETQVKDLALALASRGHAVAVLSLLGFEDFEAELRRGGVETLSIGMARGIPSPRAIARLTRFSGRFKPDIVHAHMFAAILQARCARMIPPRVRGAWKAVVSTSHAWGEPSRARYLAYRVTSPLSEQWTSVSRRGLVAHQAHGALGRHPAVQFPNGVDIGRFCPDAAQREDARRAFSVGSAFVWLAVGSFRDETKDFGTMLKAFAGVVQRVPPSLLLIAGEGSLLEEKQALARSLGLEARVRFLGLRLDVVRLIQSADGYELSSQLEGMPIVLLEAAAGALPIVTTDVGECSDIVVDGETGFVVPPRDAARLADAMNGVEAMDETARAKMGEAGRARVVARFALDAVVARWEELYQRLSA